MVSIYSLVQQRITAQISFPKMLPPKGLCFSDNKKFCAIAEKREGKEKVGIYYATNEWQMLASIPVDTIDL